MKTSELVKILKKMAVFSLNMVKSMINGTVIRREKISVYQDMGVKKSPPGQQTGS